MATTILPGFSTNSNAGGLPDCIQLLQKLRSTMYPTTTVGYDVTSIPFGNDTNPDVTHVVRTSSSEKLVYIPLYALVMLLGVVGNILVIATIASNKRIRTVTNIFLLSMAVSDLKIALVCIPINLTGRILQRFVFGGAMCAIFTYIMGVSVMVSTYTMLAISIERYYAICRPLKSRGWQTKSHACKVILFIWLASFIVMSPYLIVSKVDQIPIVKHNICVPACRPCFGSHTMSKMWYLFLLVGMFCLPGILMSVAYVRICLTIFAGFQFQTKKETPENKPEGTKPEVGGAGQSNALLSDPKYKSTTLMVQNQPSMKIAGNGSTASKQNESQSAAKKKIIVMLMLIVILYFIFWTPLYTANMWKAFDRKSAVKSLEYYIEIIKLMTYTSTCVNPIIYCFMNKKFRDGFIRAFFCCLPAGCVSNVNSRPLGYSHVHSEGTMHTTIVTSTRVRRRSTSPA